MSPIEFEPSEKQNQANVIESKYSEAFLSHNYWKRDILENDQANHPESFNDTMANYLMFFSVGIKLPQSDEERRSFLGGLITGEVVSASAARFFPGSNQGTISVPDSEASKVMHFAAMTEAEARSKFFANINEKEKSNSLNVDNSEERSAEFESTRNMIEKEKRTDSLFEVVDTFLSHFELDQEEKESIEFDLVKIMTMKILAQLDKNEDQEETTKAKVHLENGRYKEALESLGQASKNPETEQIIKDTVRDVLSSWQANYQSTTKTSDLQMAA